MLRSDIATESQLIAGYGAASRRTILIGVALLAAVAMLLVWVLSTATGA